MNGGYLLSLLYQLGEWWLSVVVVVNQLGEWWLSVVVVVPVG